MAGFYKNPGVIGTLRAPAGFWVYPDLMGPNINLGQTSQQAPMGAHPPEAPKLDPALIKAFRETEPPGFRDNPESAVEAADFEVDDTIGAE